MKNRNSGFTLIELVVVITIIGILAAAALPRYIALQREARIAKAQAIYGAVRAASALAHARCVVDLSGMASGATCTATGGTANMDGAAIAMVDQYPARNTAAADPGSGIVQAAQLSLANDGLTISAGNPTLIQITGATTAAQCQISYTEATSTAAPIISVVTTGC